MNREFFRDQIAIKQTTTISKYLFFWEEKGSWKKDDVFNKNYNYLSLECEGFVMSCSLKTC